MSFLSPQQHGESVVLSPCVASVFFVSVGTGFFVSSGLFDSMGVSFQCVKKQGPSKPLARIEPVKRFCPVFPGLHSEHIENTGKISIFALIGNLFPPHFLFVCIFFKLSLTKGWLYPIYAPLLFASYELRADTGDYMFYFLLTFGSCICMVLSLTDSLPVRKLVFGLGFFRSLSLRLQGY